MRKIEQAMLKAIKDKKNWQKDNTQVIYYPEVSETLHSRIEHTKVFLHGNHIATIDHGRDNQVTANPVTLRRWPTPTTKSRLRALGVSVSTRKGETYLNGKPVSDY